MKHASFNILCIKRIIHFNVQLQALKCFFSSFVLNRNDHFFSVKTHCEYEFTLLLELNSDGQMPSTFTIVAMKKYFSLPDTHFYSLCFTLLSGRQNETNSVLETNCKHCSVDMRFSRSLFALFQKSGSQCQIHIYFLYKRKLNFDDLR